MVQFVFQDAQPGSAAARLPALPARVRMHHLRTLLDWAVSTLLKRSAALLGRQHEAEDATGAPCRNISLGLEAGLHDNCVEGLA